MSITWGWILKIMVPIFKKLLEMMTPKLEKALEDFLLEMYKKALETENPWDDMAFGFLLELFDIPKP